MIRRAVLIAILSVTLSGMAGCASSPHRSPACVKLGKAFYLDGAGGGSLLSNWGNEVMAGLRAGGYEGEFENFHWQTGLGVVADQNISVVHKRA